MRCAHAGVDAYADVLLMPALLEVTHWNRPRKRVVVVGGSPEFQPMQKRRMLARGAMLHRASQNSARFGNAPDAREGVRIACRDLAAMGSALVCAPQPVDSIFAAP